MSRKRPSPPAPQAQDWEIPRVKNETQKKFPGSEIFDYRWFNLYICAKRRSGKTVLIYNLLKKFVRPNTIVLFFVSTFYSDANYEAMRDFLDKKNIPYEPHTSIRDERGTDQVRAFVRALQEEKREEQIRKDLKKQKKNASDVITHWDTVDPEHTVIFDKPESKNIELPGNPNDPWKDEHDLLQQGLLFTSMDNPLQPPNKRKKKPREEPEYIIIFDDLGDELRTTSLVELMKRSRHFRCKIIISSQNLFDLPSQGINQLTYAAIFRHMPLDKVEKIREKLTLDISPEKMQEVYLKYTQKPYDFILLDVLKDQIRYKLKQVVYDAEKEREE